jgi:hypothetical protein
MGENRRFLRRGDDRSGSGSTGRSRCAPRSPARRSRTRRDSECGDNRCSGSGRALHWSIGGSNGTSASPHREPGRSGRHAPTGDRSSRPSSRPGDGLRAGFVTARSRIFSDRTTAHGPQSRPSSAAPTVHSPAVDRVVTAWCATEMSPAVSRAWCLYGTPAQLGTAPAGSGRGGRTCPVSSRATAARGAPRRPHPCPRPWGAGDSTVTST